MAEVTVRRVCTHQTSMLGNILCLEFVTLFYRTVRVGDRIGHKS